MSDENRSTATIIGTIDEIGEIKSFGAGNFQKREVVVGTDLDSKYPQLVAVSFAGKNLDKADALRVGDDVVIDANLRGRRSTGGRVFTDIDAWRVKVTSAPAKSAPKAADPDDLLPF